MMKIHGGNIYQNKEMLDFSANINPLGMPDAVRRAILVAAGDCVHYPDPHCTALTQCISGFEQIPPAQIVCGNGAADLIYRISHAFQPKHALICAPTFSEYAFALREAGCSVAEYALDPAANFQLDEGFLSAISDETDIVFLCTPNNPTGQLISPELLKKIADQCHEKHTLLISDECFLRFTESPAQYSLRSYWNENCVILNAFTKLYAMPGLRLGYAVCGNELLAEKIRCTGQYWSVSVPAQAAGIAALRETEWIRKTVSYLKAERMFLEELLPAGGVTVYPGSANFMLLKTEPEFGAKMRERRILVRSCSDFHGLSSVHFRIAVRTHDENRMLLAAVREVYG